MQTSKSMGNLNATGPKCNGIAATNNKRKVLPGHTRKRPQFLIDSENPEATVVEDLEFWENKYDSNIHKQLIQAKAELQYKLKYQGVVEENLNKRKAKIKSQNPLDQTKETSRFYKTYEDTLMNTYRELENKFQESIKNRENLRKKTSELNDEVQNYTLLMEKYNSDYNSALKRSRSIGRPARKFTNVNMAQYLSAKQSHKEQLIRQKAEAQQHIEMLQIQIKKIMRELVDYDSAASNHRSELKIVRKELIKHYSTMLKEGDDSRGEGLCWIVKLLISLKKKISLEMFPSCLDERTIEVIIEIAKKSIELDDYYEKLAETKTPRNLISTEKPSIHLRLQWLKQSVRIRRPNYVMKKVQWAPEEALENTEKTFYTQSQTQDSVKLEERIRISHEEILNLQTSEVKRLTKKSLKTGANVRNLISLIVGAENVEKFMVVSMKKITEMKAAREATTTFSFMAKIMPKNYIKGQLN
ncbi:hypothetical protein SteCoe_5594 [Stentor coeruleus]|uniref:DUF4200 domain-containing protein n=1 Tax=Stentor coeruleus TaxID=5963 RepID=A0A1R2CS34_9CILI|nr:hypothetical protein SteCoe_5594 [Stentor coeruleus]